MKIENEILANPILRNVQEKFQNQQVKGLAKYGETVNPESYSIEGWLNHLQQELIDGTVYSEMLINQVSQIVEENKRLKAFIEDIGSQLCSIRGLNGTHDNEITGLCIQIAQTLEVLNSANNQSETT